MHKSVEQDPFAGDLYLAGERVPPGLYKQIGSRREVSLDNEDFLPASLDGQVACYVRVNHTWRQHQQPSMANVLSASQAIIQTHEVNNSQNIA